MPDDKNILQLSNVTLDDPRGDDIGDDIIYDISLRNVSLSLARGDMALVLLERPHFHLPLADVASGLVMASGGKARFLDGDWARCLPGQAARRRGRIGRIFHGQAWVSNLNVDENILLPHLHHSRRGEAELRKEAAILAGQFGLGDLPCARPSQTSPGDLKRAACVRAFLGEPSLLLLERPTHGLHPELLSPLIDATSKARQRGAAVLWLDNLPDVFDNPLLAPTARYRMNGPEMRPVDS